MLDDTNKSRKELVYELGNLRAKISELEDLVHEKNQLSEYDLKINKEIQKGILNNEFENYYMPFISFENKEVIGFEALVRWNHPEHGLLQPKDFIWIAKSTGTISEIDKYVLKKGCKQLYSWHKKYSTSCFLSVNLDSKYFLKPDSLDYISNVLDEIDLDPTCLKLELKETALMEEGSVVTGLILKLLTLGIQVYLDDFGVGYSSLSCLHKYPIDSIKIDYSLISNMIMEKNIAMIVNSIINLASNLEISVIAEGVETEEHYNRLRELNCKLGQGYYFYEPMTTNEVEEKILK